MRCCASGNSRESSPANASCARAGRWKLCRDGAVAASLERSVRAYADWLARFERGPGRVLCHRPWHRRSHGHAVPCDAGSFLGARGGGTAARESPTRGTAPRADRGRESETNTCRAEWSCERPGTSYHCPHHCRPGRHWPGTSCVPNIVPEAITPSAQGPARFDPGAATIGVACHSIILRVGKSTLLAVACSFHSEIRLLLQGKAGSSQLQPCRVSAV